MFEISKLPGNEFFRCQLLVSGRVSFWDLTFPKDPISRAKKKIEDPTPGGEKTLQWEGSNDPLGYTFTIYNFTQTECLVTSNVKGSPEVGKRLVEFGVCDPVILFSLGFLWEFITIIALCNSEGGKGEVMLQALKVTWAMKKPWLSRLCRGLYYPII